MKDKRVLSKTAIPAPPELKEDAGHGAAAGSPGQEEAWRRIENLPRDIGWLLLAGGLMSEVVMGLPPFWVLGLLILYPQIGAPLARFLERKSPKALNSSLDFARRYLEDMERRYPRR